MHLPYPNSVCRHAPVLGKDFFPTSPFPPTISCPPFTLSLSPFPSLFLVTSPFTSSPSLVSSPISSLPLPFPSPPPDSPHRDGSGRPNFSPSAGGSYEPDFVQLDTKEKMTYTEQAAKRKHCQRLTRCQKYSHSHVIITLALYSHHQINHR